MPNELNDLFLEQKIQQLQTAIRDWAISNQVWTDCGFKDYLDHYNDEPSEHQACVTVLCQGSYMHQVTDGDIEDLSREFELFIEKSGFWFERYFDCLNFYADDEKLNEQYLEYLEWKWITKIIEPDYTSLYQEIYGYFQVHPKRLYSLSSRKMEVLVSEIFRNQGYRTELGPGTNDKGIDVTLYQKDEIDQIVTLVQVKKYKDDLPIRFDAVAALHTVVEEQKANRGLFITTSRFLPQAKNFAARQQNRLILADTKNIVEWCENVKTRIVRDKSISIKDDYILDIIQSRPTDALIGKIVVASVGVNMVCNDFAIILKDTPHVSLLMRVPGIGIELFDAPHNFRGYEVPKIDPSILEFRNKENIFRATKSINERNQLYFWGQLHLYTLWDGSPQYFDYLD